VNKQDKLKLREDNILSIAIDVIKDKGVLDFKISEVAKEASVSIGTLYTHFQSKEDLILALACKNLENHGLFLEELLKINLNMAEKLLAINIYDFMKIQNEDGAFFYQIEHLAINPSLKARASMNRVFSFDALMDKNVSTISNYIYREAQKNLESFVDLRELNNISVISTKALTEGFKIINISSKMNLDDSLTINNPLIASSFSLINQYPWRKGLKEERIKNIVKKLNKLKQKLDSDIESDRVESI